MVQETRYSLLSETVSSVQQRLDDHASTMEMISRRLEALDNNVKGLQAVFEERLPARQQHEGPVPQPGNNQETEVRSNQAHQRNEILITDPWSSPMKLKQLTPDNSWTLFCKKTGRKDDSDIKGFKDKIWVVCGGFPAAILLLGGLLSTIQLSEWAEVINHVAGEDQSTPSNIVAWSYHKLPCVLKPCFLYLATFPKAYEIPVRRLLHLWLAEGFVPISSEASDVNVAKKYFDELVRRNMIEIQRWKPDGNPKTCLMPCYLYDEFLPKAEDIGFLHVSHGKSDVCTSEGSVMFNIQRLARQFGDDSSLESHIEHLRSYVSFNDQKVNRSSRGIARSPKKLITETGSSPLKVLDLEGVYKPMTPLRELQNLRYISFRWTCLDSCPESIGYLSCLEILDLKYTNITTESSKTC
nr:putative disease resistance rpp13-like protein 3 [Quercus suber]